MPTPSRPSRRRHQEAYGTAFAGHFVYLNARSRSTSVGKLLHMHGEGNQSIALSSLLFSNGGGCASMRLEDLMIRGGYYVLTAMREVLTSGLAGTHKINYDTCD